MGLKVQPARVHGVRPLAIVTLALVLGLVGCHPGPKPGALPVIQALPPSQLTNCPFQNFHPRAPVPPRQS